MSARILFLPCLSCCFFVLA
uniref:Uncharacterized protein n=1 Tax=Arundo donax TaxID=35708 RepID=A0A0A9F855_ARUDO